MLSPAALIRKIKRNIIFALVAFTAVFITITGFSIYTIHYYQLDEIQNSFLANSKKSFDHVTAHNLNSYRFLLKRMHLHM